MKSENKANAKEPETPTTTKLSYKQKRFIDAYLISGNATQAARKAGYSERTSYSIGPENLKKPEIKSEIDRRLKESAMGADEVLKRLADQARASLLPFVEITEDGFVYFDFSHPDAKDYMHLIKKIKTKRARQITGNGEDEEMWENEWVEVELYDAQAALVQLGRHHALFTDTIKGSFEHNVKVNVYLPDNNRNDSSK